MTRAVLLVGLLLLQACGPLPRPFQPDSKAGAGTLLGPPIGPTVVVEPLDNLPPAVAEEMREALAISLLALGFAVETGAGNSGSRFIEGRYRGAVLVWLLSDAEGQPIRAEQQSLSGRGPALIAGDPATVSGVAREAAELLVPYLTDDDLPAPVAAAPSGLPGHPGSRLIVGAVTPAPGDAGVLLPQVLEDALRQSSLAVVPAEAAREGDLQLLGSIRMGSPANGLQQVSITWELQDMEGITLGKIEQGERVRAGSLDGSWGRVAPTVAQAAIPGIVDLLYQLPARQ